MHLVPNSWGSLRENNYCHLSDGTLAPKGQGTCQSAPTSQGIPQVKAHRDDAEHPPGWNVENYSLIGDQTVARRLLGGHGMTVREIACSLIRDLEPDKSYVLGQESDKYDVTVTAYSMDETVEVTVKGPGIKSMSREFYKDGDGKLVVHHGILELDENRPGMGKDVLRSSMAVYQKLGVDYVHTTADIEVGSYAWGRYGFLPTDKPTLGRLVDYVKDVIHERFTPGAVISAIGRNNKTVRHTVQQGEALKVREALALDANDPKSIWRIVDARLDDGFPIGKMLIMGHDWHGKLSLTNAEQMRRFAKYVG